MGVALFDLERVLLSSKEKMTIQEAQYLQDCKSKAVRDFTLGALAGFAITWPVSRGRSMMMRVNVSGASGGLFGMWRFASSLDSSVDRILSQDGSRLQRELGTIMVSKYPDKPSIMKFISKHFYSERVFDDSTIEKPKIRWRLRNFYADGVAPRSHSQREQNHEYHNESNAGHHNDTKSDSYLNYYDDLNRKLHAQNSSARRSTRAPVDSGGDAGSDPLDIVFGDHATGEEIHHPVSSTTPPKVTRNHRRSYRRHRKRRQEASSDSEDLHA